MTAFKDTFVSFEISEGTHTIHLDYTPDGFYLGLASTLICIILLIMIAALIHLWKKNQAEEASLDNQEEISVSQENDLADSEDLENDLSEPTESALDSQMETDDAVIVEDDDLADEFFEEDSNEPEKPSEKELSEEFSNKDFSKELPDEMLSNKNFSKTDEKRDSSAKNVSLDSIELDLTQLSQFTKIKKGKQRQSISCQKRGLIMKLWGGRFTKETNELVNHFNASLPFDCRFYAQDIRGSIAHVTMLAKSGILTNDERDQIISGLTGILSDINNGTLTFDDGSEDIHSFVEAHLIERIGEAGKKLHTGRSRNDQVALDMKLYTRDEIDETDGLLKTLLEELFTIMKANLDTFMPGFTHLQKAQPITLAHHFGAYFEMFCRDRSRLADIRRRMNTCPLGAGALAGTTYPLDREYTASLLDFDCATVNSMDSVSYCDYLIEYLDALSIIMMHLSRFCEEIITWNTNEYQFVDIDDSYSTGSSIMPQKKNPDIAELIRGKTGRVYGALVSL